jgi:hypothetical protein
MRNDISWVQDFLAQISPRGEKVVFRDPLCEDECRWFRAAIEKDLIRVRECTASCQRMRRMKESGRDEFVVQNGNGGIRHLFSLSKPSAFNREYLPHIAAYARLILDLGYDQPQSSFSLYRKFTKDLINKKAGGWYETDAEFYDPNGELYLHVEAKKSQKETEAVTRGLNIVGSLSGLSKTHAKELEYVLDLKPKYLWVVGPGSIDPAKYIYSVKVGGTDAEFVPLPQMAPPPGQTGAFSIKQ